MHHYNDQVTTEMKPGTLIFIGLERFFRSKGHSAEEATELAWEAMNVFESWYEEKTEGDEE